MRYKHLKPWLAFGKAIYIFSWANIAGLTAGGYVADKIAASFAPLPPQAVWLACCGLGLGATWSVQGRPFYQLAWIWLAWIVRRLVAPSTLEARSSSYFPVAAPAVGRAVVLGGTLSLRGADPSTGSSLPPIELLPPAPAGERAPPAPAAGPLPVRRVVLTTSNSSQDEEGATDEARP